MAVFLEIRIQAQSQEVTYKDLLVNSKTTLTLQKGHHRNVLQIVSEAVRSWQQFRQQSMSGSESAALIFISSL